ncbi:peptide chain release factor N(5)-glutamine methyltransferase [Salinisphaera sp. Q1T1-3]|uniref:peptide chain release factor N(5)-glutamine methyltransferase n=1 Tax=Salinisphaera sp. Q1T1-3 TaxID=2321229 RepID=UPI000E71CD66|nr:peptide chain release factor N(5)-glutamine methyltransferase [Salinisphaera sp. Q1T1-3]RJS94429.1 peptide chain release factor N(5)-glutamine methyltransferase [Salinisphaera sp. Q1T1-3]
MDTGPTLDAWLAAARAELATCSDSPDVEARRLVEDLLDLTTSGLILAGPRALEPDQVHRLDTALARRLAGEPLAYVTGRVGFRNLELHVTPAVLIPRPDTEALVDTTLACLAPLAEQHVADLGTGSGAIALALAQERPAWQLVATDASAAALAVARSNGQRQGLANISFRIGGWFEALSGEAGFDAIVSNPPYIADGDPHLPALTAEPSSALISPQDGMADLHHLIDTAIPYLAPSGWLVLEHGYDQAERVRRRLAERGYRHIDTAHDLGGQPRVSYGQRPSTI